MIENIRGLPGVYTIVSPAAYRAQAEPSSENASPHLHHAQDEITGVSVTLSKEALALVRGDTSGGNGNGHQSAESNMDADGQDSGAAAENTFPSGKPAGKAPESSTAAGKPAGESPKSAAETGEAAGETGESTESSSELSEEEAKQVSELKSRDREVRAHEQAHLSAAGNLANGGPSYEYQTGPDGKRYAIGGEVGITVKEGRTPEQTVQIALQAQRAALAPADPSAQDRSVAAAAAAMAAEARQEIASTQGDSGESSESGTAASKPTVKAAQSTPKAAVQPLQEDTTKTADDAAVIIRGRKVFSMQSQAERGYLFGVTISSMSLAA